MSNSDRLNHENRIRAVNQDNEISLPENYHYFENYYSRMKQDDIVDLPRFYQKTPHLA